MVEQWLHLKINTRKEMHANNRTKVKLCCNGRYHMECLLMHARLAQDEYCVMCLVGTRRLHVRLPSHACRKRYA
jgi:hypothetical protein